MTFTDKNVFLRITFVFVLIGALNWGLIGLFDFNLVAFLFDGISPIISRIIYTIVGLSAVVSIIGLFVSMADDTYQAVKN